MKYKGIATDALQGTGTRLSRALTQTGRDNRPIYTGQKQAEGFTLFLITECTSESLRVLGGFSVIAVF